MQFDTIIFCRTFKNYFGQFVWIEKKRVTIIVAFHFMKRRLINSALRASTTEAHLLALGLEGNEGGIRLAAAAGYDLVRVAIFHERSECPVTGTIRTTALHSLLEEVPEVGGLRELVLAVLAHDVIDLVVDILLGAKLHPHSKDDAHYVENEDHDYEGNCHLHHPRIFLRE